MSGNSPGGWGPPQGPPGPWGAPPQGSPQQGPGQQSWGNPQGPAAPGYGPPAAYGPPPGPFGGAPGPYGAPPTYGAPYGGNPYGPPASPGFAGYQSSSDTTTWALVLAILSWFTCYAVMSVPAFFMARSELQSIDRGEIGVNNRGNAQAAYWIAAINMGVSGLIIGGYVIFFLFIVGMSAGAR